MKMLPPGGKTEPFDRSPIKLDGWTLRHRAAVPAGKPTLDQTAAALYYAGAAHDSSPYWVGDILAHAESREDFKEKFSQLLSITDLAEQTLHNLTSVSRRVAPPERDVSPSVEHSKVVQKLSPHEQRRWLKKARTEGWGKRELDQELKASQKRGVISGTADLEGMFRVWSIDFPWKYKGAQPSGVSAQSRYPGMTIAEGIKMGDSIRAHTMKHAVAFFWVPAPFLYYATDPDKGPDPYRLIRSWGFESKTGGVWDKVEHNFGNYLSIRHEHLIIATRGSCTPDRPTPMLDSVFTERKSDVHSAKPKIAIKMMERLYDGPYVEMFAREERKGWTTWGNQVNAGILKEKAG